MQNSIEERESSAPSVGGTILAIVDCAQHLPTRHPPRLAQFVGNPPSPHRTRRPSAQALTVRKASLTLAKAPVTICRPRFSGFWPACRESASGLQRDSSLKSLQRPLRQPHLGSLRRAGARYTPIRLINSRRAPVPSWEQSAETRIVPIRLRSVARSRCTRALRPKN